jgi:hypothetical protein
VKKLLLLVALAGGAYFYYNNQSVEVNVDSYNAMIAKAKHSTVTLEEVKAGANLLTTSICNDVTFQVTGGSTVKSCTDRYLDFKSMCEERVFGNAKDIFTDKQEVVALVKRFVNCSGIS